MHARSMWLKYNFLFIALGFWTIKTKYFIKNDKFGIARKPQPRGISKWKISQEKETLKMKKNEDYNFQPCT